MSCNLSKVTNFLAPTLPLNKFQTHQQHLYINLSDMVLILSSSSESPCRCGYN